MQTSEWSREEKLLALMAMPWDVQITTEEDGSFFAQVAEVRDAVADAQTERELARELWQSLYASLALRLDRDDPIPLPAGRSLPWIAGKAPAWHPVTSVAPPLVLHREAYLSSPQAAAAGDFVLARA